MRFLILGAAFWLAACASPPGEAPVTTPPAPSGLNGADLRGAIGTGAGCADPLTADICESVLTFQSIGDASARTEEISLFRIATLTEGPVAALIQSRPPYAQYRATFERLAAQRGDAEFIKVVQRDDLTYANGRWCTPVRDEAAVAASLRFYFATEPLAAASSDRRIDATTTAELVGFLRALMQDAPFRALLAASPETASAVDTLIGGSPFCTTFQRAELNALRREMSTGAGARLTDLDDILQIRPRAGDLRLNPE